MPEYEQPIITANDAVSDWSPPNPQEAPPAVQIEPESSPNNIPGVPTPPHPEPPTPSKDLPTPEARAATDQTSDALRRILAIIEQIPRPPSTPSTSHAVSTGIISRIERLERWVQSNRLQ